MFVNLGTKKRLFVELILFLLFFTFYFGLYKGKIFINNSGYLSNWAPWSSVLGQYQNNSILSDSVDHYIPILSYLRQMVVGGHMFLWTDKLGFGSPLLLFFANGGSSITLFPFLYLFPLDYAISLQILARLLAAFFAFRLLLTRWKIARGLSVVFSFAYAFSLHSIVILADPNFSSYSFLPLAVLSLELLSDTVSKRNISLLVFSLIAILLAGFPSTTFYMFMLIFSFAFFKFVISKNWLKLVIVIFSFVVAVMFCAPWLGTTFEFLNQTNIGYRSSVSTWYFMPKKIGYMLSGKFFGSVMDKNFFTNSNWNEENTYQGLVPLLGFALSVVLLLVDKRYRRYEVIFLALATIIVFIIVFNVFGSVYLVAKLPIFNVNASTRLIVLLPFCFCSLAAMAFNHILKFKSKKETLVFSLVCFVLAIIFLGAIFLTSRSNLPAVLISYRSTLLSLSVVYLIIVFVFYLRFKVIFPLVLLVIVLLDIAKNSKGWLPSYSDRSTFYPLTDGLRFLKSNLDLGYKFLPIGRNIIPSTEIYYGLDSLVDHYWASQEVKALVTSFAKNTYELHPTQVFFESKDTNLLSTVIDMLGVKYITTRPGDLPIYFKPFQYQVEYNTVCSIGAGEKASIYLDQPLVSQKIVVGLGKNAGILEVSILDKDFPKNIKNSIRKSEYKNWMLYEFETGGAKYNKVILLNGSGVKVPLDGTNFDIAKGMSLEGLSCSDLKIFIASGEDTSLAAKFKNVYGGSDITIYENASVMPSIYSVDKIEKWTKEKPLNLVNFKTTALVENPDIFVNLDKASIEIISWEEEKAKAIVSSKKGSFLVMRKKFYPGWEVFINGVRIPSVRVNGVFTGIYVPAGDNQVVEIKYYPNNLKYYVIVQLGSLVLLALMLKIASKKLN